MRVEQIEALIRPAIEELGCELWGIQLARSKHTLLRIYIDTPQGAGIEDCERVSKQVSRILDVEDPISGEYTLEVSSPGLDRPLFTLEQFQRYSGSRVDIRLQTPFQGRRKFLGKLVGIEGDEVIVQLDDDKGKKGKGRNKGKHQEAARKKTDGQSQDTSNEQAEELILPIESIEKANVVPVFDE